MNVKRTRKRKGELTHKILEIATGVAAGATIGVAEAFLAVVTSPYGSSRGYLERRVSQIDKTREEWIAWQSEKARFYKLIHKLRKEGFLLSKGRGQFAATPKGKMHWLKLQHRRASALPSPSTYSISQDEQGELKIVIFDIPEKEKRKREWLRSILRALHFSMLQKSVWTGKTKIPEELLEDIKRLHLISYVEIFEITRTGSLEKVV